MHDNKLQIMPSRNFRGSPLSLYLQSNDEMVSESSTITADDDSRSKGGASRHRRRRVRLVNLDLSATRSYTRPPIDSKELARRWYSTKDTSKMKESTLAQGWEYGKQCQSSRKRTTLHSLLGKLLEACSKAKRDTNKTLLKPKDFDKLAACLQSSPDCVGLESAINTNLTVDKLQRRYNLIRQILANQGQGDGASLHEIMRGRVDARQMSQIAASYSLASRLLARHLAQAAIAKIS